MLPPADNSWASAMSAAIAPVAALLGVGLGGWSAHILSLRREREARRYQTDVNRSSIKREKLEELYSLISIWSNGISIKNITFMRVMKGHINWNDANEVVIKHLKDRSGNFDKIEMLIDAYAPSCRGQYNTCLDMRKIINDIHFAFENEYRQVAAQTRSDYLVQYAAAGSDFEREVGRLKAQLVSEIRYLDSM